MNRKRTSGAALTEAALVIIPYLVLTFGGIEYMWHLQIRQALTAAADKAVHAANTFHDEEGPPGGSSPNSLQSYLPAAEAAATGLLTDLNFSEGFINSVEVNLDYVQHLRQYNPRMTSTGGFPQKDKMRLIGAVVSVPWEKAMFAGNFAVRVLHLAVDQPTELVCIVLKYKKWKTN
ncbi:MAG: TadE/TadG family type IV pilus assembly protein [Waddliaceae bacterium]